MSELRHAVILYACLFGCGQAEQAQATPASGQRAPVHHAERTTHARATAVTEGDTVLAASLVPSGPPSRRAPARAVTSACPTGMVRVANYCIDRYEAYVVELDEQGREVSHSPYTPVDGLRVRAKVAAGVVPQGYISQVQAADACDNAGKRLCSASEFSLACRGPKQSATYPYGGTQHQAGKCNEGKGSAIVIIFGQAADYGRSEMNDPRLNQWPGGLAKTGAYAASASPFGVFDLVGNLHEWSAEVGSNGHGYFRGGYFGDAEINGSGCDYVTTAHAATYHDYSTGFRCCKDASEK